MQKFSQLALAGAIGLGLTCGGAFAQSSDPQSGNADRSMKSGQTMSVTGCLMSNTGGSGGSNGAGGSNSANGQYMIKGDDGKTWSLTSGSSSVNLSEHLNHKVTVTGKVANDGQSGSGSGNSSRGNSGKGSGSGNSADRSSSSGSLEVSDVKMVSSSCQ